VEFPVLVEDALDNLGDDPLEQQNVADQLMYDLPVEPAVHQNLPNNLEDRVVIKRYQMTVYNHGRTEAKQCEWIVILWVRWVDAKGILYPQGVQDTWLCL